MQDKRYCKNCGKGPLQNGKIKRKRCIICYNFFKRTGRERPKRLFIEIHECQNSKCKKPLKLEKNRRRKFLCNACYIYKWKHKVDRPKKLCHPKNTRGWCSCGERIVLTKEEIENNLETKECFVCRSLNVKVVKSKNPL